MTRTNWISSSCAFLGQQIHFYCHLSVLVCCMFTSSVCVCLLFVLFVGSLFCLFCVFAFFIFVCFVVFSFVYLLCLFVFGCV